MEGFVTQLHFQIMITETKYEFNTTYQDFFLRKKNAKHSQTDRNAYEL